MLGISFKKGDTVVCINYKHKYFVYSTFDGIFMTLSKSEKELRERWKYGNFFIEDFQITKMLLIEKC
jgi:hypothetical protein